MKGSGTSVRSKVWHQVWDRRDGRKLSFDGYERSFTTLEQLGLFRLEEAQFIVRTLSLSKRDHLLDLGCGTGALTALLVPHVERVTAVDYSSDATKAASRTLAPFGSRVEIVCEDIQSLDYTSNPWDKVVAVGSLYYLDSYRQLVSILGQLVTGGAEVLVMEVPDIAYRATIVREYDVNTWSHLYIDPSDLVRDFPGVRIFRNLFPNYQNDRFRFSFWLPSVRCLDGPTGNG